MCDASVAEGEITTRVLPTALPRPNVIVPVIVLGWQVSISMISTLLPRCAIWSMSVITIITNSINDEEEHSVLEAVKLLRFDPV